MDMVVAAAHDRQWSYLRSDPSLDEQFQASPFNEGTERTYTNVVRGSDRGRELILFDFRHETYEPGGGSTWFSPAIFRVLAVALHADRSEHEQLIKTVPDLLTPYPGLRAAVDLEYLLLFDGRHGRATGKGQHWIFELHYILPLVGQLLSGDDPSPPTRPYDRPRSSGEPPDQ